MVKTGARSVADWQAIVESAVRRFRPIVLTAAAADALAMYRCRAACSEEPMAVAIMGGLVDLPRRADPAGAAGSVCRLVPPHVPLPNKSSTRLIARLRVYLGVLMENDLPFATICDSLNHHRQGGVFLTQA
jgi:hypothetical protein